jgi:hypothetical protein
MTYRNFLLCNKLDEVVLVRIFIKFSHIFSTRLLTVLIISVILHIEQRKAKSRKAIQKRGSQAERLLRFAASGCAQMHTPGGSDSGNSSGGFWQHFG